MSTKALRKELFAAVAMLIVAAIALSGSTYAWFAANTTVTAEEMEVTVVSDTTFLLIGQGPMNADAIQSAKQTVTSAAITSAAIKPTQHQGITIGAVTSGGIEQDGVWYYRYSSDPANATASMTAIEDLDWADANGDGKYVLVNTFSLTVASGSNKIENLKVSNCSITATTGGVAAVRVIVAGENGSAEFSGTGGTSENVLVNEVTSTTAKDVKIYIFWDGDDSDVFTNNIANLLNTSVVVTFTGTPGTTAI